MAAFVALLRAVNVGGTGKLPMSELRELCEGCGFENVRTYIQSGNVVLSSTLGAAEIKQTLELALEKKMGKSVAVHVRTPSELATILARNPFSRTAPNRVLVLFLDSTVPKKAAASFEIPGREEVHIAGREVYVHYPDGIGRSKLKLPFAKNATARNLNTVRKLLELGRAAASGS